MSEKVTNTFRSEPVPALLYKSGGTQAIGIALVLCCAVFDCGAQLLLKQAANELTLATLMAGQIPLAAFLGFALYGLSAVLLVLGLQRGELSVLYPILATTYIWVVLFSPVFFVTDNWTVRKFVGVFFIAVGVSLIGSAFKR